MLHGVCLGTNDLARAGVFYDRLLASVGMVRTMEVDNEIGYGPAGGKSCFWVLTPYDGQAASFGNGTQVTFRATSNTAVDGFHRLAIELGGVDEGAPGFRYRPRYYGAYCRDLDGNKLHVMFEADTEGTGRD
ncbi:VOC family protein [Aestuariirhabdus sp. Z084]|uniref:VOC family protein n=1 Tax=Aestuariirhabdus haliotis TaxID=2918751 RepID=UPI0020BF74B2|nr:VOC family protein [Aestuariirhabdus haliotis]MCL6416107.1 VOC family protein [Aestuariirhabdus haliotis]